MDLEERSIPRLTLFLQARGRDQLSPKPESAIQENQESKQLQPIKPLLTLERPQIIFAPKPVSRIVFHETSEIESRHTPEVHSLPPTTSSPVNSKHGFDSPISCASVSGGDRDLQIPQADKPQQYTLNDYAKFFIADTLPRQLYLLFLFRLPALYFLRVARIFEEADLAPEEIEEMAVTAVTTNDHEAAVTASDHEHNHEHTHGGGNLNPQKKYDRLKDAWELLINRFVREWETFNVVSVLLLPAIVTMFQINGATDDPVTRYLAFWSLICALLSSLYDCLFIICFPTMRKPHKAAAWAFEALKAQEIFWNVWVMLAMPAVWMCWMDEAWRLRAEAFSAPPMSRTMPILPPEYSATDEPVAGGTGPGGPTGHDQDRVDPESPCRDRATVSPRQSTPNSSNSPPAYPPPPNHTTYSKKSNHTSVAPSFQPLAAHKSSKRQKNPPSGEAVISREPPLARSVSPHHRQTFTSSRPSDIQKALDEERGRSPINQADYVVESSRTLVASPQVRAERSTITQGRSVSGEPSLLDFNTSDGDILLDEIHDKPKATSSR
ncbi:hypothetical protein AGABI1DRAFT_105540 [Agaricus bisporus var. burnettii JB137-S8]|uniref:Uncharacterized protein n=1 Tax=Agaricus bisporus var. burnettii (strain JB137-S8 / ATCC MYA-4627 / FGSC 10392) TaxID=597362 RepID=K5XG72_AGABU|nr:uncharacterized protein AGABI1DRAFT_105540 [Agaricus bisporus var. burnettii JB137-S8]EKM82242.1 hypothetical protein AGABI1DRAFT_105540 [Agaricus bisporus var. burnettii JB137-S8]